jgi:starvation-inducible outer membrane lipoprotein
MKRVLLLVLTLCLMLSSCKSYSVIKNSRENDIRSEHSADRREYVVVKSTLRFHTENCSLLPRYEDSEKTKIADLKFIRRCGYTSCKYCLPYL